jgi:amidase
MSLQNADIVASFSFHHSVYAMEDIPYLPATEILRAIHSRQVSVEYVAGAFLDHIKRHNPRINAIVALREEEDILQEAREKDRLLKEGICIGPLHGLPMTVKDSYQVQGLPVSNGMFISKRTHALAIEDAELVKRLKKAGAILIGKTNLPMFSIDWQSTNTWFGQTNNPYDLTRVAGGSSGGSAAAVAMGLSPLELGSDAGGSIRVPAHFCGICGMRTTEQALSNRGQYKLANKPQGHRMLTVAGPLAKNITDLMLLMEVLWGKQEKLAEIPPVDFHASCWNGEKLTIGYATSINNIEVDAEYLSLFTGFLEKVRTTGHVLQEAHPAYDEALAYHLHGRLLGFEMEAGSPAPAFLTRVFMYLFIRLTLNDPFWAKSVAQGIGMSAKMYLETIEGKEKISDIYTSFFHKYDIWITPVASIPAFKHQKGGKPFIVNGKKLGYTQAIASFHFTTALSGHPVVVIPIGQTSEGMPVGIQIHSMKWTDKRVLQIANYLESLTSGFMPPGSRGQT